MSDDLFAELDASIQQTPVRSPEEDFCAALLMRTKADILYSWLTHQMYVYYYLFEDENIRHVHGVTKRGLDAKAYSKFMLKYYLQMYHMPKFLAIKQGGGYLGRPVDINKVIDVLLQDARVSAIVTSPCSASAAFIPPARAGGSA